MALECYISDFKSGRCSSSVDVKLIRFWEIRNVRYGGDFFSLTKLQDDDLKPKSLQAEFESVNDGGSWRGEEKRGMTRETEHVVDEKTTQRKIGGVAGDMFNVSFTRSRSRLLPLAVS
ncbi:hypothetical protein Rs2_19455 [Raphanus sativus]|nr:hypothetical protein Rs2_19455 [Raphanus sativus]